MVYEIQISRRTEYVKMERFLIEEGRAGIYLLEKNGSFRNHRDEDLIIAEIHDIKYGQILCDLLNKHCE